MAALRNTGLHFGFIRWFIPLILFLIVVVMFCAIYGNSSAFGQDTVSAGTASKKFWLLTVNSTASVAGDVANGHMAYGFGVFGWCEWGSSQAALEGEAQCYGGAGWKVPGDAGTGSTVDDIDLPWAIAKGLSGGGLFLIVPILTSTVFLVIQGLTHKLRYNNVPPHFNWYTERKVHLQKHSTTVGYRCSSLMRSWFFTFPLFFFFTFIPCLIVIVFCGLGKYAYGGRRKTSYTAKFGTGWKMLMAAMLLELFGLIVVYFLKPWRRKEDAMPAASGEKTVA